MQVRTLKKDGRRPQRYGCSKGYVCTLEKEGMEMKTALKRSMAMLLAIVMALSTVTWSSDGRTSVRLVNDTSHLR